MPRGPARPGPAHRRQKNAAGPGPRGRVGGTALYRRKQLPTRAPCPAGGCAAPGGTRDCEPTGKPAHPRRVSPGCHALRSRGHLRVTLPGAQGPRFTLSSLEQLWLRCGRSLLGLLEDQRALGSRGEAGEHPPAAPRAASANGPCSHAKGRVARRVKQPLKGSPNTGLEQRTAGELPHSQAGVQSLEKQGWGAPAFYPRQDLC